MTLESHMYKKLSNNKSQTRAFEAHYLCYRGFDRPNRQLSGSSWCGLGGAGPRGDSVQRVPEDMSTLGLFQRKGLGPGRGAFPYRQAAKNQQSWGVAQGPPTLGRSIGHGQLRGWLAGWLGEAPANKCVRESLPDLSFFFFFVKPRPNQYVFEYFRICVYVGKGLHFIDSLSFSSPRWPKQLH